MNMIPAPPPGVELVAPLEPSEVERLILRPCLALPEFQRFYAELPPALLSEIQWMITSVLWGGGMFMGDGQAFTVTLKQAPVDAIHVQTVAHELFHAWLRWQGYPTARLRVQRIDQYQVMSDFHNMLQHLIIQPGLQARGFDALAFWRAGVDPLRQSVQRQPRSAVPNLPPSELGRLRWALEWARYELEYQALTGRTPDDFYIYRRRFGVVETMAEKIVKQVKRSGWDTADAQKQLLLWFIDAYKLDADIVEDSPHAD